MYDSKEHCWHCILYEYQKGNNVVEAAKNCGVFGETTVTSTTFEKFRSGDFSLKEKPRSGRPTRIDNDVSRIMKENKRTSTSIDIAKRLGTHQTTTFDHIKQLGFVSKHQNFPLHPIMIILKKKIEKVAIGRNREETSKGRFL
ncbi:Histone-lysine N-methyltransferase SETMAR [Dufourea novaeangliae]|uniref:Histone-lysine N-methyltransferase SETMAR n=1 Tax=Dufourea novaeangliae TaxID=178035 RepID=A0A154P2F3_DUFNO|nr:Histone-lysine N-methyltransferase SETMAR [Dufourea novaeangliae]